MERLFNFNQGEFYHVYSRGVDRRPIFSDDLDREHFQKLLFLCNSPERVDLRALPKNLSVYDFKRKNTLISIGAYCLMPNHFHLLLQEYSDGGISKFMSKLLTAYVMYFNKKTKRTGTLFDGRFRARHVADDSYMHYLYAYIHLNPIKLIQPKWKENGIKNLKHAEKFLADHFYSSYLDFCGVKRLENSIVERSQFPGYFRDRGDFSNFIADWLQYSDLV